MQDEQHLKFMQLALQLAKQARGCTAPNPMVGCVIVKDNNIIGSGYHHQAGQHHAEINAILSVAAQKADSNKDSLATVNTDCYVTLEPCCHYGKTGPCVEQIIKAQFKTVIIAMEDPNPLVAGKGVAALKAAGIQVITGICEEEAKELNKGFISRITRHRPYIRSKIAASLDGCIALENGQSKWITNSLARQDVHLMRSYSDAIVTTASTVLADNPKLNARLNITRQHTDVKQPIRVVIDKNLVTTSKYDIYNQDIAKTIIISSNASINNKEHRDKLNTFDKQGVAVYTLPLDKITNRFNMVDLWHFLAELGCNDVMVEAGGIFNSHLLLHNNVDEWFIYQSGLIMGNQARKMFSLQSEDSMSKLFKLKCKHVRQLDDNWLLVLSQE